MGFDVLGARNDGYTDDEIADYLSQQRGFNITGARDDGYSSTEIIDHLVPSMAAPTPEEPSEKGFLDRTGEMLKGGAQRFAGSSAYGLASGLEYFGASPETQEELKTYAAQQEESLKGISPIKPLLEAESLGDVASSGYDYLVQSSPYMGAMLTGAYAGGKAAAALPIPHPAVKAITMFAGGLLGGAAATYNAFFGDNVKEAEQVKGRKLTKEETEGAAVAAVGQSIADAVISKILPSRGSPKLITNTLKKLMQGGAVEGTTEVFQESLSILQANDFDLDSLRTPEATYRLKEAGLAGMVIGAGLQETLDVETETTLEEDTADGEQSVTEADMASEGQLDLNFASEEVAQDEVESAVTPPASDEFVTEQVEGGVDETVAPDVGPVDIAGVSDEVVDEQLRQIVADPPPEGPAAPDLGELDLEVTEPVSPEFQPSTLETFPVAEEQLELFDTSTIEALTASAQSATPKLSIPEHIVKKIIENLNRRLQARGLADDVSLIITDTIFRPEMGADPDSTPSEAKYIPRTQSAKGAIILALDALPESTLRKPKEMATYLAGLTDHETVHSWVDLGVINDNDMQALAKAASLAPHWSDPNKTVMDVIADVYPDLDAEGQIEEAAAELFRGHAAGNVVLKGRPLSIWQRILNFFRNLKGGLAEADIYKAAQVFDRVGVSPDFVSAAPAARTDDFGDDLVQAVSGKSLGEELRDDKEARSFQGGPDIWGPEPGKPFGTPQVRFAGTVGGQVYGWGLYFSQSPVVGRGYATRYDDEAGQFLELDIPDDAVAKFLDYDLALSEQPENVQQAVKRVYDRFPDLRERMSINAPNINIDENPRGRDLYQGLADLMAEAEGSGYATDAYKEASLALAEMGIPGHQYGVDPDISTRPTPEGLAVRLITLTGSVDGAIVEAQERIADAERRGVDLADSRFQAPAALKILQEQGDPREYNYVIWDQDVLNRVEVKGVNDVPVNQVAVNLSSATESILGLKELQEQANTGDIEAQRLLQDVASDSLSYLLSGIPDVRILSTPAQGLYFGDLEPSIGLDVGFVDGKSLTGTVPLKAQNNKDAILAALAKFADNFNQEQIHVRTGADENTDVGFTYPDGSYNTASVRFSLREPLTRQEIEEVISSSGLVGVTATDTYLDAYYVGDPSDAAAIQQFKQAADRASKSLEGRTSGVDPAIQRLWAYGEGYGATNPYSDIRGPLRPPEANEGNRTSWRIGQRLRGRPFIPVPSQQTLTPEQRDLQSEIADAFDNMPLNDLGNPDVRRSYDELARELDSQYRALPIKVEVFEGEGEPYANSAAMREDINQNNHLFIYGTNADTFGPEGVVYDNHPMLKQSSYTDVNGYPLLINDLLRAVHDYYAHTMAPNKFGPLGEEAAWQNHMRMTRSPWARWALTSETRGQNSWVNFHRLAVDPSKRADSLPITEREFSEQKTALLPIEYTMTGDPVIDEEMLDIASPDKEARNFLVGRFYKQEDMFGVQFVNEDGLGLVGGSPGGASTPGTASLRFAIMDQNIRGEDNKPIVLGQARINVQLEDGKLTEEIEGLVDIEIEDAYRNTGIGSRVINSLLENTTDGLNIYDIQESALPYWRDKQGTSIVERSSAEGDNLIDGFIPKGAPAPSVERTAASPDKEARRFVDLPKEAQRLVRTTDANGRQTARFGTIQYKGNNVPVVLHMGTPEDSGMRHADKHLLNFETFTPYESVPIALKSLMTASFNPERQAPRKSPALTFTEGGDRGQAGKFTIEWQDPASRFPIKAAFTLLEPNTISGVEVPVFAMDTIFVNTGRETPAYQAAETTIRREGVIELDKISRPGREAVLDSVANFKQKAKKEKFARPISQEFSIKSTPTDMGIDMPSGVVAPQRHETLGEKVLTNLGMVGGNPLDSFGDFFKWFRRSFVDMWDPIRRTEVGLSEQDAKNQNFLSASSSAWAAMRRARRATAITAYSLSKGVPTYRDGYASVKDIPEDALQTNIDGTTERSRIAGTSTGFIPIIEPLRNGNRFDPFHLYAIARRAARLIREGRERLLTQDQIAQYLAMGNSRAEIAQIMDISEAEVETLLAGRDIKFNDDFSDIFQDYQVWNGYFVEFLVDTGVLTREKADIWKESADYIPFYRQLDREYGGEAMTGENPMFKGLRASAPPPELKGKGMIWSVIAKDAQGNETMLPTTFSQSEKNVAEAYAQKYKDETGMDVSVVRKGMPIGGFLDTLTENALSAVQTGMMNVAMQRTMRNLVLTDPQTTVKTKPGTPGSVTFHVKGEPITLYVGDRALYSSLENYLDNQRIDPFVNFLGMPARFLREMITRSPDFMAANMLRDSLSAWVTSGRDTKALIGTIGGFSQALRGSTSADALAAAGLMTGFDFGGDPTKMTQFIDKELLKYKYPSAAGRFARNPLKALWDATGTASRASDAATRIAVYERVLKDTGDEAQAIFEAEEVINFSARGSSALIKNLAVVVPFLNARIQGLDVLYRSSMGSKGFAARPESDIVKRRFMFRAMLVAMSSAAYWAMVHDDEEYINQNPEIKDNYWIIPSAWIPGYDGPPLKFPIPFEVGFLFKTIPERVMALYFGKDVPRDIAQTLRRGLVNTFEFNPIPQAVMPPLEAIANYSFFTGREIEGQYLKGLEPGYRYNSRTSALAIKLGEDFNYSPVKIDHMIRGYGGTLGTVVIDTVDQVMRETAASLGERPSKQLSEYPFVKRFLAKPDARGLVTQFYELRKAVNQAVKTSDMLEKGDLTLEESVEFSDKRARLLAIEDDVKEISGVLSSLRDERKRVMQSDISPEEKREEIDRITAMELMAVESIPELRQEAFQ